MNTNFIKESNKSTFVGYGLEIGGYYDRELLERVFLVSSLSFNHRDYRYKILQVEQQLNPNSNIDIHQFEIERKQLSLTPLIGFRCVYNKNPEIYLIGAIGLNYYVRDSKTQAYQKTVVNDSNQMFIQEKVKTGVVFQKFTSKKSEVCIELGTGFEINKTGIEIFYRKIQNNFNSAIGIRIRHQIKEFNKVKEQN